MIDVSVRGVNFSVALDDAAPFWGDVSSGKWEPATFDVMDRCITADTIVLDVGAWIGPTTLYAARRARSVISFEPDLIAFSRLKQNLAQNPDIQNVEVLQACVSNETGTVRLNVRDGLPGGSGSSLLMGDPASGWDVPAVRLDEVIRERGLAAEPLFIKMDIEGFEYTVVPALIEALEGIAFTLYLSTHPHILWASIPATSAAGRLRRRFRMISTQGRLVASLKQLPVVADSDFHEIGWSDVIRPLLNGQDLTLDRNLIAGTDRRLLLKASA